MQKALLRCFPSLFLLETSIVLSVEKYSCLSIAPPLCDRALSQSQPALLSPFAMGRLLLSPRSCQDTVRIRARTHRLKVALASAVDPCCAQARFL